jgi:hypothetical protein
MGWGLVAEAVANEGSWRWRLLDDAGGTVERHEVSVDADEWEWEALRDLPAAAKQQFDPADPIGAEALLASRIGRWTADRLLGPVAARLAREAPAEVTLTVPAGADWLLGVPLSIAEVDGSTLAFRGVVFAGSSAADAPAAKEPIGARLRVLAVFSVPVGQALLDLRRERKGLADLVTRLGQEKQLAIDLRILQYGVTKERLQGALAEKEGWDVVHFSGHGAAGRLALEDATGQAQLVDTTELVAWLGQTERRLKLVTLSACSSAAFTVASTLRSLGVDTPSDDGAAPGAPESHGLASDISRQVRCAVVAMRFPVVDAFAVGFSLALHQGLWENGLRAAEALGAAIRQTARVPPTSSAPAFSAFTPAMFGTQALDLRLSPPPAGPASPTDPKMSGFDAEPARFVGRTAALLRANAALASASGRTGVVFHGMAGSGKTACALEVAYGQRDNFSALIWWRCPGADADPATIEASLLDFANRLDQTLGTSLAGVAHDTARLDQALPGLTLAMAQTATLVAIDNVESLLTDQETWNDPRWEKLVEALVAQGGHGRLILTARRAPATVPQGMIVEAVNVLSREEAVLLSRQLPNLARLLDEPPDQERPGGDQSESRSPSPGRQLVRRVLEMTGGHPKLLELADAQAIHEPRLESMLSGAAHVWSEAGVDAARFLTAGDTAADPVAAFAGLVQAWTVNVVHDLDEDTVMMAMLLCRCDPADRTGDLVSATWADLRRHLDNPDPVPEPNPLIARLVDAALIETDHRPGADPGLVRYQIHPVVASTLVSGTPDQVADTFDRGLAEFWQNTAEGAIKAEAAGRPVGSVVVQATRQATLYVLRIKEWSWAIRNVEQGLIMRDPSPDGQAEAVRLLRRIAASTKDTDLEIDALGLLGNALLAADPAQAELILGDVEARSARAGRDRYAAVIAGDLVSLFRLTGRYADALQAADRKTGHTTKAGLGPWSELANEVQRLEVYRTAGDHRHVLVEVDRLAAGLDGYPPTVTKADLATPWNTRETLFDLGLSAATFLERWPEAFDWGNKRLASMRRRGAGELETARAELDTEPAVRRVVGPERAQEVLEGCRPVFESHQDYSYLANCVASMSDLEDGRRKATPALNYAWLALRFSYLQSETPPMRRSHHGVANLLDDYGEDRVGAAAHWLAALILLGMEGGPDYQKALVAFAQQMDSGLEPPGDYDTLCATVDKAQGVRFRAVVETLGDGREAFSAILTAARAIPPEDLWANQLAQAEPVLALMAYAASGYETARTQLGPRLDQMAADPGSAPLAARLERLRDGQQDPAVLGKGLQGADALIVARGIEIMAGRLVPNPIPTFLRPIVAAAVAAARHDQHPDAPCPDAEEVAKMSSQLTALADFDEWRGLGRELRRLLNGETRIDWAGLGPTGTAIMIHVSIRIAQGG